jgi:hypothetical protein
MPLNLWQKPLLPLVANCHSGMKGGYGKNPPIRGFAIAIAFPELPTAKTCLPNQNTGALLRLTPHQGFRSLTEIADELRAGGRLPSAGR